MKTNLNHVACLMMGLTIAALAADQHRANGAASPGLQKGAVLIPTGHPFPLISSARWSNGYYAPRSALNKGLSSVTNFSPTTTAAVAKLAGTSAGALVWTSYFRNYKGPRWLTNAAAVSNAVKEVPLAGSERPLPPTGLRVIAVGR